LAGGLQRLKFKENLQEQYISIELRSNDFEENCKSSLASLGFEPINLEKEEQLVIFAKILTMMLKKSSLAQDGSFM